MVHLCSQYGDISQYNDDINSIRIETYSYVELCVYYILYIGGLDEREW